MIKFISLIAFYLALNTANGQQYTTLVLKGGGIRGIAYAGAIKVLEEKNVLQNINNVAGTSVGAIVASLIAVGYNAEEIKDIMMKLKIEEFNDGQFFFIGGQKRLRKNFGWYKGEVLEDWLGDLIKAKTGNANTTLAQLHDLALKNKKIKNLYITTTNLSKQRMEIFSWQNHPNISIKTAVHASIAIPLYFSAVLLDSNDNRIKRPGNTKLFSVYIDGGLLANYPLNIFDSANLNSHTLGLKLERPEQIEFSKTSSGIAPYNIYGFNSYIAALYNIVIENLNKNESQKEEQGRTIYISTNNLGPKVRHIPNSEKEILYDNGMKAAKAFFLKNP
ncbi:MAG TPA: patatin-like phospholipase family protein [Flavipsychrobacter sp.]|nr:patatin-like phospholipase family protein [Flavipsychrobacter sp.]